MPVYTHYMQQLLSSILHTCSSNGQVHELAVAHYLRAAYNVELMCLHVYTVYISALMAHVTGPCMTAMLFKAFVSLHRHSSNACCHTRAADVACLLDVISSTAAAAVAQRQSMSYTGAYQCMIACINYLYSALQCAHNAPKPARHAEEYPSNSYIH
eukprot:5302-Heterococcus_DN1.PRE.2